MRNLLLPIVLAASACDSEPQRNTSIPKQIPEEIIATPAAQSKPPLVIPMPKDQAEADRLILAGYTPHADHLHPPGMKKCPLLQEDNQAVM